MKRNIALCSLALFAAAADAVAQVNPAIFPTAAPESVGMSSGRLNAALDSVGRWVDEKRINGGILLVVRDGKLVFHEAVGWNDVEKGVRMQRDDILLMRSMTKPMTGTGVLMLAEEGRLGLDDEVHRARATATPTSTRRRRRAASKWLRACRPAISSPAASSNRWACATRS
jgi:CubicO group peptidase (beta-lactamase class C family)